MTQTIVNRLVDTSEAQRAYSLLVEPDQVAEIRIFSATTNSNARYLVKTISGYFDNSTSLIQELASIRTAKGIYITLNPCVRDLLSRAHNRLISNPANTTGDNDIVKYRWLPIDIDPKRPTGISSSNQEHDQALQLAQKIAATLARMGWPEPIIADSGNGAHLLYRIELEQKEADLVKRVLQGLADTFNIAGLDIDQTVFNPSRIFKLYGTLAGKGDDTPERPHRMARILSTPQELQIVTRSQLEAMARPIEEATPKGKNTQLSGMKSLDIDAWISQHNLDVSEPKNWNGGRRWVFDTCPWNSEHTDKSAFILQFASGAIAAGCQHNGCNGKYWQDLRKLYEPDAYTEKKTPGIQNRTARPERNDTQPNQELPEILIGKQLREETQEALNALIARERDNPHFFVQQGKIKHVGRDEKLRPGINEVKEPELRNALTNAANFFRGKAKGEEIILVPISPPKEIVQSILALEAQRMPFPAIDAIVQTPVLRKDGTILDIPGYDRETTLYYMPQHKLHVPAIPNRPAQQDALAAMDFLAGLIQDFPWEGEADRANMLALMLTTVTRQMFRHVPIALIDATKQGTGKGLLTDLVSIILTGESASALPPEANDEELDKRITALLLRSETLIVFDNVESILKSPILAKILTSEYHKGRVLGKSEVVDVPQRAIWIANGNNLQVGGDMARRAYRLRMITQVSNPDARENFKYPKLDVFVKEHRGEILAALLTVVRAWFVAGKPAPQKKLRKVGTFTEWSEAIGGMLAYAGIDGFLANVEVLRKETDVDGASWSLFLETWIEKLGEQDYKTAELILKFNEDKDFAATLPDPLGVLYLKEDKAFSKKLGKALGKQNGTAYGSKNLRIVKGEDTHAKVATYKVAGYTPQNDTGLSSVAGYAGFQNTHLTHGNFQDVPRVARIGLHDVQNDIRMEAEQTPHTPQSLLSELETKTNCGVSLNLDVVTTFSLDQASDVKKMLADFKKKFEGKEWVFWTAPKTGYANSSLSPQQWYERFVQCYTSTDVRVKEAAIEALTEKVGL